MSTVAPALIYSTYSDEFDMRELIELFVAELPTRVGAITRSLEAGDWEEARRFAHQLKGASGSYGFGELTAPAAGLEEACKGRDEEAIRAAVEELVEICSRVRA